MLTADYSTNYGPLAPGGTIVLRFRAHINPTLPIGTRITNTGVVNWSNPPQTARASVSIDVGGMVGVGILNGRVWHDANFNTAVEANERLGFPADARDFGVGAQILVELGVRKIRLLTNNPRKRAGLEGYGLEIVERVPLEMKPTDQNLEYLRAKQAKLGHLLSLMG